MVICPTDAAILVQALETAMDTLDMQRDAECGFVLDELTADSDGDDALEAALEEMDARMARYRALRDALRASLTAA